MVQLCISASALPVSVLVASSSRHCPSLRAYACKADANLALLALDCAVGAVKSLIGVSIDRYGMPCRNMFKY